MSFSDEMIIGRSPSLGVAIAEGGAMADTPLPAQIGEILIVDFSNIGPVRGVVAWAEVGRFGIKFGDKVDPRQVRRRVNVSKPEPEFYDQPDLKRRGRPGFRR